MRYLITGGCGFIGSNFIRFLMDKYEDIHIVNLDKLTYCGNSENLKDFSDNEKYSFFKGDICDEKIVNKLIQDVDIVINFAAETHVDRSIKYPNDFINTNIYGVKVLLEAAKNSNIKKFIQIGTDEVYGSVSEGESIEEDPLKPNSPYSATKAAGDLLALSYYQTYGVPVTVVRSSNNFGPFQYPEKVIPLFITNLLTGKKVSLYGDGGNVRDWLYVGDNCAGIDVIAEYGEKGKVYNLGGNNCLSNLELTAAILSKLDKGKESIEFVNDRPGHDRRYALNSVKSRDLGWKTEGTFDERLKETIHWYKENVSWWKPLKDKAEIIEW